MKIKLLSLAMMTVLSLSAVAQEESASIDHDNWRWYISIGLCLCLLAFIIFLITRNNRLAAENDKIRRANKIRSQSYRNGPTGMTAPDDLYRELENCKVNYENCIAENKEYARKIAYLENELQMVNDKEEVHLTPMPTDEPVPNDAPINHSKGTIAKCEQDGSSYYLRPTERSDRKTLYRIFEKDNRHFFTIDHDNKEAIDNALRFYDVYLDGYCESSKSFQIEHTRVEVLIGGEGKLLMEGDRYKVIEKLKVKFS